MGRSSVTYDIGFFDHHPHDNDSGDEEKDGMINEKEEDKCTPKIISSSNLLAARGKYVHVYIDKATGRPTPIPDKARRVLELLLVDQDHKV